MRRTRFTSLPTTARRTGVRLHVSLLVLMLALPVTSAHAATPAAPLSPASLTREMDSMVAELLASDAAKRKLQSAGQRVSFEGMAWDAGAGQSAGTSPLGLRLGDAVGSALERRRIGETPGDGPATRGIGGAILKGAFGSVGSAVGVVLSMVDANSGRVVSEVRRRLDPNALVDLGMNELLPPNAQDAKLLARLVSSSIGSGAQPFKLKVRTVRGANAAYFEGDRLQVEVEADRDCHLRLYHVSWTDKRLTLIFPNRSEPESRIAGSASVRVPADGSAAVFEVARPYGVDAIVAIASEQPFEDEATVSERLAREVLTTEPTSESEAPTATEPAQDAAPEAAPEVAPELADGLQPAGEFLSEPGVDEARTRGVLTRGLVVRHQAEPFVGPGSTGSESTGLAATPVGDRGPVARAVCYFTTLPRLSFAKP